MAGLAVVAADQEGNRHILDEQCARFFQPGHVADLKRVLQTLASAPTEVRSLQLAARRRAETDSCWERESQRLLNLYLE
jgi:glycosyltransferase involved in cell wall biosynthesis